YQGGLEESNLEGRVKDALAEELSSLESKLAAGLNNFPIEDFAIGMDISKFFGGPATETSPGHIGACLKTDPSKDARQQLCVVAQKRLPANHEILRRYCSNER